MPDRTRPIRREICLNEQELSVVRHKMNQLGTRNFGAYAREMLIDGYIIKVDYTEQKKLAAACAMPTAHTEKRSAVQVFSMLVIITGTPDSRINKTRPDYKSLALFVLLFLLMRGACYLALSAEAIIA